MKKCEMCGFKYAFAPESSCSNCGYHFSYIDKYSHLNVSDLKILQERICIRTGICAICEKGETRKGFNAYVTVTNKGVEIEIFEKFQYGTFMNKKWRFQQNPRFFIPYNELKIKSADYDSKKVAYFCYISENYGELRLNFNADASISSKYNLNEEMKQLCEEFISAG